MLKKLINVIRVDQRIEEKGNELTKDANIWENKAISKLTNNLIKTKIDEIIGTNMIEYLQNNNPKGVSIDLTSIEEPFKVKIKKEDVSLISTLSVDLEINCIIKNECPKETISGNEGIFRYTEKTFRQVEFNALEGEPVIIIREDVKGYLQHGYVGVVKNNGLFKTSIGWVKRDIVGLLDTIFVKEREKLNIFFTNHDKQIVEILDQRDKLIKSEKI